MVGELVSRLSSPGSFKRCPGQYAVFLGETPYFNISIIRFSQQQCADKV